MKQVLLNIESQLAKVSSLKHIDEDWGQIDNFGSHPPVKFPCALVSVTAADYTDIGQDRTATPMERQMATGTIAVRFAAMKLTNTSARAPLTQKQQAWDIWDIIEDGHKVLQGFIPADNCAKLVRTSLRGKLRDDGIQEYRVLYTFGLDNV